MTMHGPTTSARSQRSDRAFWVLIAVLLFLFLLLGGAVAFAQTDYGGIAYSF